MANERYRSHLTRLLDARGFKESRLREVLGIKPHTWFKRRANPTTFLASELLDLVRFTGIAYADVMEAIARDRCDIDSGAVVLPPNKLGRVQKRVLAAEASAAKVPAAAGGTSLPAAAALADPKPGTAPGSRAATAVLATATRHPNA